MLVRDRMSQAVCMSSYCGSFEMNKVSLAVECL